MRSTRGAQRREVKVVPLGVSVFTGCEKMPVHSAIHFRWPLTAQLRSSCLGVIDLQPVQAVDCRSRSTVYGSPAFCAVARPVCHCWCDSSRTATKRLQLSGSRRSRTATCKLQATTALLHALHLRPTFCVRVRLAPLLPSVRFACIRYSASLLQPTPTLPLTESRALLPPPFATSSLLQHLSSHRARRVALASGHESDSEGDTPSRIQHSSSGLMSTCRPPLQRATASLTKAVPELRTAFD